MWKTIDSAPIDSTLLLYCPHRHETNVERIEIGCAHTSTGSHHAWATHWAYLPNGPSQELPNLSVWPHRRTGRPMMPKGPKGEKRPADVIGNAIKVAKIATGEEEEALTEDGKDKAAVSLGRRGGKARAASMSPQKRSQIAKKAARKRWSKST